MANELYWPWFPWQDYHDTAGKEPSHPGQEAESFLSSAACGIPGISFPRLPDVDLWQFLMCLVSLGDNPGKGYHRYLLQGLRSVSHADHDRRCISHF